MRTQNAQPGKYEGNESQMLARAVHQASLDGTDAEFGDMDEDGYWVGLVIGKRYGFMVEEDSDGFVNVWFGSKAVAIERYAEAQAEYARTGYYE